MDTDGYPDEEELKLIEAWDWHDPLGLLEYIHERWQYADSGYWSQDGNKYNISTAGWSGNEDLIAALERNTYFWMFSWVSSRSGGHYEFDISPALLSRGKEG